MARSRLTRIRGRRDSRIAIFYLLLAGILVFVMLTWGISWMAKVAGLLITKDTGAQVGQELRPTPPIFSDVPESVKEDKVTLSGFAQPGINVALYVNGAEYKRLLTDDAGVFTFDQVPLVTGNNRIYAYAIAPGDNASEQSKEYVVELDNEPPELTVSAPADGETFHTQAGRVVNFQGLVNEDGVKVTVGDRIAIVSSDGSFSVVYQLQDGDQEITVKAVDKAGNETEQKLKLRYEP